MSNISRRDFLKTAGVMTLAVAAAGVLAGCEGNKPAEVPGETTNSVTVGDFTVSIKEAKQYAVKHYDETTGKVDAEERYVVVLCNVMNNDPTMTATAPAIPALKPVNMYDTNWISDKNVKELFNLDAVYPLENLGWGGDIDNVTKTGVPCYVRYHVKKDAEGNFMTPAFSMVLNETGVAYHTLTAVIPEAVEIENTKLGVGVPQA